MSEQQKIPLVFHQLAIAEITHTTTDSVVVSFTIPDALKETFSFIPGQYLTLRAMVEGKDIRRSYSICSPIGSKTLSVGIKRITDGAFSSFAQNLKIGDTLEVMPPQGRFVSPIGGKHDYLLLAAGSGVTPILSIAASVLESEAGSTVTLCYANRNTDSVMFRRDFDNLKDRYMTRFLLTHVMDEEAQDVELFNGRLDGEKLETMATRGLIKPKDYDAIFICGPQPMIEAASKSLMEMGVSRERIKFELFTPSTPLQIASATKKPVNEDGAKINVTINGSQRSFIMAGEETVIDAAARSGLELPYSCANGMCATCRCKLAEGDGVMVQNFSLEEWETNSGFVLACQFRPSTPSVTLDFDAV